MKVPKDFEVKPLRGKNQKAKAQELMTCGHCKRSWDDAIVTRWTPTMSGRCPFEYFHDYKEYMRTPIL